MKGFYKVSGRRNAHYPVSVAKNKKKSKQSLWQLIKETFRKNYEKRLRESKYEE